MKDAVVIGKGMVGNATMHALGIDDCYSLDGSTIERDQIGDFKYIFICVPTPTVDGVCDVTDILDYIKAYRTKDNIFIIRSTIVPGTVDQLEEETNANIVHMPEFLTEKTWKRDAEWPDVVVIGSNNMSALRLVEGIMKARHKGADFFITDARTAELAKYAINVLYATKVIYANQMYDFCKEHKVNYSVIREILYSRKWIGKNHLDVWHGKHRGAGGKCLGKDVDAFASMSKISLVRLVNKLNKEYLEQTKDTDV